MPRIKHKFYELTELYNKDDYFTNQARALLNILEESGGRIERTDFMRRLPEAVTTVQEPSRVWSFYRQRLLAAGIVRETVETEILPDKRVKQGKKNDAEGTGNTEI